jgi:N-acetylglucosamine kinase-like BadF-type ATPase
MSQVYLGIDGGGSKTSFCAVDEKGNTLGQSLTGGTSIDTVSPEETQSRLLEGTKALHLSHLDGVCACLGGILSQADKDKVIEMLHHLPGVSPLTSFRAENDAANAFRSVFRNEGIVFIVGTGSVAMGKGKNGKFLRLGGYGYKEGDLGSGYNLGWEALRSLARFFDGRGLKTHLDMKLLEVLGIKTKEELATVFNTYTRTQIAALAPIVVATRSSVDSKAILNAGATEYASMAESLCRRLNLWDSSYAVVGGIGSKTEYLHYIQKAVKKVCPHLTIVEPSMDPAKAAAFLVHEPEP